MGFKIFSKERINNLLINKGIDESTRNKILPKNMKNWLNCKHLNIDQLNDIYLICFDCGYVLEVI